MILEVTLKNYKYKLNPKWILMCRLLRLDYARVTAKVSPNDPFIKDKYVSMKN